MPDLEHTRMKPQWLYHARAVVEDWVADYYAGQPHSALGFQTPATFAVQLTAMGATAPNSTQNSDISWMNVGASQQVRSPFTASRARGP